MEPILFENVVNFPPPFLNKFGISEFMSCCKKCNNQELRVSLFPIYVISQVLIALMEQADFSTDLFHNYDKMHLTCSF